MSKQALYRWITSKAAEANGTKMVGNRYRCIAHNGRRQMKKVSKGEQENGFYYCVVYGIAQLKHHGTKMLK